MILYFSATGNSEYVARRIAAETGDIAVSITDCYKKQIFSFDEKCKTLGIVSPTYSWGLPVIVIEFLQRLDLSHKPDYIFFIATYGTTTGKQVILRMKYYKSKYRNFGIFQCENARYMDTNF